MYQGPILNVCMWWLLVKDELLHEISSWIDGRKFGGFTTEDIKWRKSKFEFEEMKSFTFKLEEEETFSKASRILGSWTLEKREWDKRTRIMDFQSFFTHISNMNI